MSELRMTRDFFLWCMCAIYLFAFASLYTQIPGLYGDNGILPAKLVIREEPVSLHDLLTNQPTLLRLLPRLGLDVATGMDFLCLAGIIAAMAGMIARPWRNAFLFTVLWAAYFSLFQVGQTFLWFQWDILLLESGFLCILLAPLNLFRSWRVTWYHQHDRLTFWLLKWLLFRLMFASGVVKLNSGCATWWGLTALNYHYETQCLPTAPGWLAHQLPEWFQKFSVMSVYVIQIGVSFLFFSPVRSQRLFSFYAQVFLQLLIFATGNYNFFNLLTIVLCITLLDDDFLRKIMRKPALSRLHDDSPFSNIFGKTQTLMTYVFHLFIYGGLVYWTVRLFNISVDLKKFAVNASIGFSKEQFDNFLRIILPVSIVIALFSLLSVAISAIYKSMTMSGGMIRRTRNVLGCLILGSATLAMFGISLAPYTDLHTDVHNAVPDTIRQLYTLSHQYKLTKSYGLFGRMTGVGGRPEVIIEGSNNMNGQWKEYDFLYKPGNVSYKPTFVAPHQPRLDWQMWFAALGSYQHNPWFLNLCWRLLNNEKDVLQLMGRNPFPDAPPKYIKATLYHYHFTHINKDSTRYSSNDWWVRKQVSEYLPIITADQPSLISYLKEANLIPNAQSSRKHMESESFGLLAFMVQTIRTIIAQPNGFTFTVTLFIVALLMSFFDPSVDVWSWPELT